jgi:hypothetical protein
MGHNQRAPVAGKRILFWKDQDSPVSVLGDFITGIFGLPPGADPRSCVRNDIPYADRQTVAKALELRSTMNPTGAEVLMGYFGLANCRICNVELGSRDLHGHGFVWPEKAEHYILNHNVWTADCDALLAAVRMAR